MVNVGSSFSCKMDKRIHSLAWISGVTLVTIVFSLLFAFIWLSIDPIVDIRNIYTACIFIPLIVAPIGTIIAIRKRRLVEKLAEENYRLATVDALTGLPNRRAFMAKAKALQETTEGDRIFACFIGDADNFKQVNDTYGHPVGDEVLGFLGKHLFALEADDGIVARLGGEEFAVAGLFESAEAARNYGDTLIGSIARQTYRGLGVKISMTISMGLAVDRGGESISMLLSRADKALYCAKANGKNRLAEAA